MDGWNWVVGWRPACRCRKFCELQLSTTRSLFGSQTGGQLNRESAPTYCYYEKIRSRALLPTILSTRFFWTASLSHGRHYCPKSDRRNLNARILQIFVDELVKSPILCIPRQADRPHAWSRRSSRLRVEPILCSR